MVAWVGRLRPRYIASEGTLIAVHNRVVGRPEAEAGQALGIRAMEGGLGVVYGPTVGQVG